MNHDNRTPHLYKALQPLAWLYGACVWIRNKLFDRRILPVEEFSIPVISIGNIAVGGTGKTPMTEHLIELLSPHARIAMLSRGYRRKSKGFVKAHAQSAARDIGDEPYQIFCKYPHITVAVDTDRRRGIKNLLQSERPPQIVLLDDAFQHRYVKPAVSIVLCDSNRMPYHDRLLPAGRLRESVKGLCRADIVILTKCPHTLSAQDYLNEARRLHILPQQLYASHIEYGTPYQIETKNPQTIEAIAQGKNIIVLTGIANPTPMVEYLKQFTPQITLCDYPDHHNFTAQELQHIEKLLRRSDNPIIITTEKDAARLSSTPLSHTIKSHCYVLPLKTIIQDSPWAEPFDTVILKSVGM